MKVPFLDLKKQLEPIEKEIISKVEEVIRSGKFIMGDEVKFFEEEISEYLGVKHAIACASGTDALLLSLMSAGVGFGDEVITTPFTFFATAGAISRLGAKPVFVDIDEKTFNIDVSKIEEKITSRTKAIIPVHIFGQSCEMDELMAIAERNKLFIIEDSCQAIGSEYKGKKVGTIGNTGCFSFFPTKNLGGYGDGGIVVTNDDDLASYLRKARLHGSSKKYHHDFVGINSRLDALQAAVLRIKLKYLDEWNSGRIKVASEYSSALKDLFVVPFVASDVKHIFHQYALLSDNRDEVLAKLKENNVAAGVYYPVPLHLQECFKELGYVKGDFPVCEKVCSEIFSLPIYPEVDYERVIEVLKS